MKHLKTGTSVILFTSVLLPGIFSTSLAFSANEPKALIETSLGPTTQNCPPNPKPEKRQSLAARERARLLKPIFATLAKELRESPLQSLCSEMPNFACWPDGYSSPGTIEIFESEKGRFLIRVPCTTSAYNQTSFFVAAKAAAQANVGKRKSKGPAAKPLEVPPALLLFPTHPDFQSVPQFQAWGLKPLEAIIGFRDFELKNRRITAYTKGLGDGTFGHFHQYEVPFATMVPRLQTSIAKTEEDRKDPYHYERGQVPPFVKSWVRMRPLKASFGCLANIQDLECRVFKK